jgi:Chlorophyll A-B binding protein
VIRTADVKTLPGISAPFENIFDPADLIGRADGSVRPVQEIKRWREAEITHSRVAMLAAVGFVIGEQLEVGGATEPVAFDTSSSGGGMDGATAAFDHATCVRELGSLNMILHWSSHVHCSAHRAFPPF